MVKVRYSGDRGHLRESPLCLCVKREHLLPFCLSATGAMAQLLADTCRLVNHIVVVFIRSVTSCIDNRKRPGSPTLSAQEGELDNLLTEPSGGWDDLPATKGYNKAQSMTIDPENDHGAGQTKPSEALPATWVEGRTMEELSREEEELARFDPPGPPRDVEDFGDFEQAPHSRPL